jgi:hypothetical protein
MQTALGLEGLNSLNIQLSILEALYYCMSGDPSKGLDSILGI